jgi:hypothetical protein
VFDTRLVRPELDAIRRSAAIGNGLTRGDVERLVEMCNQLLDEREQICAVLDELGPAWNDARTALNRLARIVR